MSKDKYIDLLLCAAIPDRPGGMYIRMQDIAIILNRHGLKTETMFNSLLENRIPNFLIRYISAYLIPAKIIFKLLSGDKIRAVEIHEPSAYFYCILRRLFKFLPFCYVNSCGVEESVFEICSKYVHSGFKTKMLQSLRNFLNLIAFKYSDLNVFQSLKDKYFVEQRYRIFHNILTGCVISPELLQKVKKEGHKGVNIAFIGNWIDIKGARVMEEIIPRVLSKNSNIHFYLLGVGIENKKKIDEKLAKYMDRVTVVPQYNHSSDLPFYLNSCDILLAPSIYDTGSHAILEGLHFKLTVICSENCFIYTIRQALHEQGAIISVVPDDIAGYVNHILDLAKDEAKRIRLSDKGQEILKGFTWDRILVDYIKKLKNGI